MTTAKRDTYTPETLLTVAVKVFNERGYDGTSMEHLSKAAGISKSSIYHHVTGKEELLRRAVSRAIDGLFGVLDEPGAQRGRSIERVEYVTRRTVDVLTAELPYVTLLLRVRGNTGPNAGRWSAAGSSTSASPICSRRPSRTVISGPTWTSGWRPGCSSAWSTPWWSGTGRSVRVRRTAPRWRTPWSEWHSTGCGAVTEPQCR